ncbi:MAG: RnfABCDGE type electron transport complex subunit B [Burkholderiales bacterium]
MNASVLVDAIDAELPQTQCRQCGYAGCRPYAEAIARGETGINRCPPAGIEGLLALARVTGLPAQALDPACGSAKPRAVAVIDEAWCIGCTLCIEACPVDAIVGAPKRMHTVLAEDCTGCELCLPPCPVDCIALVPLMPQPDHAALLTLGREARARHERRNARRARHTAAPAMAAATLKRDTIARAVERARARLRGRD